MARWKTRKSVGWLCLVVVVSVMLGASAGRASVITFDLDYVLSGPGLPPGASPWLTAIVADAGVDQVTLTLSTPNLTDLENVKFWMFNLDPTYTSANLANLVFTEDSRTGSFTDPIISTATNGFQADGDGNYDIQIAFDNSDGVPTRFGVGDSVVYTISGIVGLTAESFNFISHPSGGQGEYKSAAHIGTIGQLEASAWVSTPEPATLGLMVIGSLVLLRKRRA